MGVKLQLLLGLLLICSTCGSEENTTNPNNASLENVDSTNNYIEKLPKTDTQINLVNKDTQDNSDNIQTLQNNLENDTHDNQTSTNIKDQISNSEDRTIIKGEKPDQEEDSDTNESNGSKNDRKGREDSSRSIDIEKYDSHEFHNNDYSSSNSQKVFENSIRKASTKRIMDYSEFEFTTSRTFFEETKQKQKSSPFQLTSPETFFKFEEAKLKHKYQFTTPKTPKNFIDTKYEEDKQKLEQEYEESAQNIDHVSDEIDDDDQIHKLFVETKHKPNSSLDYKEKTKISKNNTINDGSEYNELRVETTHNINYDSVYNFTSSDEDDTEKTETTSQKEKQETTSPRGFVVTTKKTISLTKPPTGQNNHILSNKIESETIKAINFLTTEFSTTKRLKEENDLVPNEQTVEENKIIPLQPLLTTTTEVAAKSTNDTEPSTTTEQIKDTTPNPSGKNIVNVNATTEQTEQTTATTDQINEATTTESYTETSTNNWNYISKLSNTETVTEQTTTGEDDNQTTTEQKSKSLTTDVADTTTTESNTIIPTTVEIKEQTTEQNDTTELFTTEQLTTENLNRISKAFAFESTQTETTEMATTETITIKLSPKQEVNSTADDLTVIMTGAVNETTTEIVTTLAEVKTNKTENEITSTEVETESTTIKMVEPKVFETSTSVLNNTTEFDTTSLKPSTDRTNLLSSTKITTDNDNISTIDVGRATTKKDFNTTLVPSTNDVTAPAPDPTFILPVLRNVSVSTEESSEHTTAEDSSESSSTGSDIGGLGTSDENKGKIAAIVISTVGAVCLILLAGLLYVMRKRQRRFNYKQRCRPVGLDDYSVDNVSGYNSTRRKVERQSKRSYGNPAFDDPVAVTHPLNFPALAKFSTNTEDIKAEFQEIPQITAKTNELPEGCETKNRYANVIPLPETRVFLQTIDGYPNSDYINANYVTGPKNTKGYYIACQGPMTNTVDDFWRMVWEQQTKVILMLTHLFENGVEKCVDYLPPSEVLDCNRLFGDFQVTLKKRDVKEKYIISNLQLKNMVSNSWREITHFWYLGWPEKGVPSEENSIIAFLIEARSYMKSATLDKNAATNGNINGPSKNEVNPVVVHCSPGTGRTGVVIACDIAIREFEQTRLVDIPKIVYKIRRDRASAVQTKEQYMFIYKVVSLYATKLTGGALDSF